MPRKILRDNVSFSLVKLFIIFRHWAGMFRPPLFFSAWLSRFHSPPPLEHFEHKKFLDKKRFPFVFGHGRKPFQHCVKNIPGEVVRHNLQIHKEVFFGGGGELYWKRFFCHFIWTMIKTFSVFVRKNSIRLSILHTKCLGKNLEEKKSGCWKKSFQLCEEKFPQVLSKLQFTCSWEQFERKNFLKQFQFSIIFVY